MSEFVDSLRRLYKNNMVCREKIIALFASKRITKEEMEYILHSA